jgi:hypothetical protein
MNEEIRVPLYDCFDGFSRRKRLRHVGYNPDTQVTVTKQDWQKEVVATTLPATQQEQAS